MKFYIKQVYIACALVLLVLAVSALSMRSGVCFASGDDWASLPTISDANAALQRAFRAALDAEATGANVSRLLGELNVAGRHLTLSEIAYAEGNMSEAANQADDCAALADAIASEAANLKDKAVANGQTMLWQTVAFSLVGVFVFLVGLVLVWVLFKRSYGARLLRAKPEVAA